MNTTTVICNCTVCNGSTVEVKALTLANLPTTKSGSLTKAAAHGLVWHANHSVLGRGFRSQVG